MFLLRKAYMTCVSFYFSFFKRIVNFGMLSACVVKSNNNHFKKRAQAGASMIEVLVAIVILSFALLGIAGLLSATTRFQMGVEARSALPLLTSDVSSRLRTNLRTPPGMNATLDSAYQYATSWNDQQGAIADITPKCGTESGASACTNSQLAAYDVWQIRNAVRQALPQGAVQIRGNPLLGMEVSYIWFDKNNTQVGTGGATELIQVAACPTTVTDANSLLRQNCCPAAADVASTPGVRCMNFAFVP